MRRHSPQSDVERRQFLSLVVVSALAVPIFQTAARAQLIDHHKTIDSLRSRNSEPELIGDLRQPLFDKSYDWSDQDRIVEKLNLLWSQSQVALPVLVDHLNDSQYCVTVQNDLSGTNWTVGDACYFAITDFLSAAYRPCIPSSHNAYLKLAIPAIARGGDFREWCVEQLKNRRPPYELQAEMCEWAIVTINIMNDLSDSARAEAIRLIQMAKTRLLRNSEPVLPGDFLRPDSRTVFTKRTAEALRLKFENRRRNAP